MNTGDLIQRLGRDAAPVRRLAPARVRTGQWLAWAVAYLTAATVLSVVAMRGGVTRLLPLDLVQLALSLLAGVAAARAAFESVVPGSASRASRLALVAIAAWVLAILPQAWTELRAAGAAGVSSETDWPCVASMVVGAGVLGVPLVVMLRRGAPLTPHASVALAGLAALSLANIEACLTRAHQFQTTVLLWHGLTIAATVAVFAAGGARWLRWPSTQLMHPDSTA